jgi:hypothetical protein
VATSAVGTASSPTPRLRVPIQGSSSTAASQGIVNAKTQSTANWSSPAFVESDNWIPSCHGPDLPLLELYRCKHLKRAVTTLAIVEDLEIFEDRVR